MIKVQTRYHELHPPPWVTTYWVFILKYFKNILNKLLCYGLHKTFAKNMSLSKKCKSLYKSFYCLKTLITMLLNVFGYFSFIKLISNFKSIYTNTLKITLCESNSIWSSLFFNKMLDTQNQTLVIIACMHINVIAPIMATENS